MPDVVERATRDAWDAVATAYARLLPGLTAETPLDRAVIGAFVEIVKSMGDGVVADVGCGTGRVTSHLSDAGLVIHGFDLSPEMARVARSLRPDLSFSAASARHLPIRTGTLGGIVAWYSLINLPTSEMPEVLAEFARVTRPEAPVLVAFQSGHGERVERATSYGRNVPMTYYRHRTDDVVAAVIKSGFRVHATVIREPALDHESTQQSLLLAHAR